MKACSVWCNCEGDEQGQKDEFKSLLSNETHWVTLDKVTFVQHSYLLGVGMPEPPVGSPAFGAYFSTAGQLADGGGDYPSTQGSMWKLNATYYMTWK